VGVFRGGFFFLEACPFFNNPRNILTIGQWWHCFMDNTARCAAHTLVAIAFAAYIVAGTVATGTAARAAGVAIVGFLFLSPEIISYGLFSFGVVGFFPCREAAIATRSIVVGPSGIRSAALLLILHQPPKTLLFGRGTSPAWTWTITTFCCRKRPSSAGARASSCSAFSCKGSDRHIYIGDIN